MVECPMCEAAIDVDSDELDEGDSLVCEECGASLNVVGLDPLELEAEGDGDYDDEEDEDYDDDDDDEDEDEEEDSEEHW